MNRRITECQPDTKPWTLCVMLYPVQFLYYQNFPHEKNYFPLAA